MLCEPPQVMVVMKSYISKWSADMPIIEFDHRMKVIEVELYRDCIKLGVENIDYGTGGQITLSRQEFADVIEMMKGALKEFDE